MDASVPSLVKWAKVNLVKLLARERRGKRERRTVSRKASASACLQETTQIDQEPKPRAQNHVTAQTNVSFLDLEGKRVGVTVIELEPGGR